MRGARNAARNPTIVSGIPIKITPANLLTVREKPITASVRGGNCAFRSE